MLTKDIAIIGGGIAGLTLAIALKNSRFKCHIFEKNTELKEVGAAISVFPNALRVLRELRVMQDIIDAGGEISKIYIKTDKGEILNTTEPRYVYPAICIHRAELHKILLSHAEATFHTDHALTSFQNLPDGRITCNFANGVTKIFDGLIGADGINSVVRQSIIGDGKPIFRGYNIWRGVAKTNFDIGYASESYGRGMRVGIVPIKEGTYGWWATCNEPYMASDEPEGTRNKLERLFGQWHDPIPELMSKTDHIIKNSLSDRLPTKGWTKGHCTLVGDAAHPTTPNLGQGGCLAIEGAYLLGEVIKKYGISDICFEQYEKVHFPHAKVIIESSLQMGEIGQLENRLAVYARNMAIRHMPTKMSLKMVDKFFTYDATALDY